MKKFFGLFFTLTVLFLCSNVTFADSQQWASADVSFAADFSGKTSEYFSFTLKNISKDTETDTINWDPQKVILGKQEPQWIWSTSYAVVTASMTTNSKYYMYQKNTESTVFKSTAPRTVQVFPEGASEVNIASATFAYSGLVNQASQGGEYAGYVPLSFVFVPAKLTSEDLSKEYDPDDKDPTADKAARYFLDNKNYTQYYDQGEPTTKEYTFEKDRQYTLIACDVGPVFGPYGEYGPWSSDKLIDHTAYMYFGGNFMNISHGSVFGSDKIVIMKVVE